MAITVRIPAELDARLQKVADEQHVSKNTLLLRGAALVVDRHARRADLDAGLDVILSRDAELLRRLEDA